MHTILYAALRSRLVHQIQKALHHGRNPLGENIEAESSTADETPSLIPLKQIRQSKNKQLEYVSAVALKYALPEQETTLRFAENLVAELNRAIGSSNSEANLRRTPSDHTALNRIQSYFDLEIAPPGWIFFRFSAQGLAVWLQFLIDRPLPVARDTSTTFLESQSLIQAAASARNSTSVFLIQHTYARCNSLLRLGQELGLIQGRESSREDVMGFGTGYQEQIQMPTPLPWLLPTGEFRGRHPAEWQLVEEICACLDAAPLPSTAVDLKKTLKQADRLSQSWQSFHAHCRIADEVQQTDPAQAQIRLGLTCITQKLLHYLLRSIELPTPLFL